MADYTIQVHFDHATGQITFPDNHGNLSIPTQQGFSITIDLVLHSSNPNDIFEGILISKNLADVDPKKPQVPCLGDSRHEPGGYYPGTCFQVSQPNGQTLHLVDEDRPNEIDSGVPWYYALGVKRTDSQLFWQDPKIENEGDGSYPRIFNTPHGVETVG